MSLRESCEPRSATELELDLPRWFRADQALRYLGRDPKSLTEEVVDRGSSCGRVRVGVQLAGRPAALSVELGARSARCRLEAEELPDGAVAEARRVLERLLGLVIDPRPFERRAAREPEVARLITGRRGLSVPQTATVWDGLVWVVCGQQVSLPVAFAMRRRLTERAGTRLDQRLWAPPAPAAVAELSHDELRALGLSRAKADYLSGIARDVAGGPLAEDRLAACSVGVLEERLSAVRGLGPWSVNYLLMRSFGHADRVPVGDVALVRKLQRFHGLAERPDAEKTRRLMAPFAPHRSLATFHLWALEE